MRRFDHILTFDRHVSGIAVTMILGKPRIYVNGACEIAHTGTPWSLDLTGKFLPFLKCAQPKNICLFSQYYLICLHNLVSDFFSPFAYIFSPSCKFDPAGLIWVLLFFTLLKAELKTKCLYLLQNETSVTFKKFQEGLFFILLYIYLTVKWINLISLFVCLFIYLFILPRLPRISSNFDKRNPLGFIDKNVLNTQDGYSGFQEEVIKNPQGLGFWELCS